MNKHRFYSKNLLKWILSITILVIVFFHMDFHFLLAGIKQLSFKVILLASIFCFLSSLCQAVRWAYLSKPHLSYSFFRQMLLFWQASFFNLITPAALGGDIYRILEQKKNNQSMITFGLIIRERLLGLMAMSLCYLLCLSVAYVKDRTLSSVFLLSGGFCLVGILSIIFIPKILTFFVKSYFVNLQSISVTRTMGFQSRQEFFGLTGISMLSFAFWIAVYAVLANALISISFEKSGLVGLITELSRWIPLTIQGVGVRESVSAYGFQLLGYAFETGFLVAGLAYCTNIIVLVMIGFFSFVAQTGIAHVDSLVRASRCSRTNY